MTMGRYYHYRSQMRPGDVIAYSGTGFISNLIKWKTGSFISHVGMVYSIFPDRVHVIESTTLNKGIKGVAISRLSQNLEDYPGKAWWYQLNPESRIIFDQNIKAASEFFFNQNHKPYDYWQAFCAGTFFTAKQNFDNLQCSELCSGALLAGKVISGKNPAECTPKDVINFDIYDTVVQLKG